jgi:hypothetical protein
MPFFSFVLVFSPELNVFSFSFPFEYANWMSILENSQFSKVEETVAFERTGWLLLARAISVPLRA